VSNQERIWLEVENMGEQYGSDGWCVVLLLVARCLLLVARCLLLVICCLLFVACCLFVFSARMGWRVRLAFVRLLCVFG